MDYDFDYIPDGDDLINALMTWMGSCIEWSFDCIIIIVIKWDIIVLHWKISNQTLAWKFVTVELLCDQDSQATKWLKNY